MSGHRGKAHRLQAFVQLEKREWNMMRKTSTYGKAIIFVVIVWMVSEIFSFPSVMRQPDTQIKLMNGSFSFNGYFDKLLNNYNRPSTAPSGFPWPTTAAYIQGFEILNVGGLSSITIDNSRKEHDVFVRVVVHTVQGNFPVRQFYIPAFGSFTGPCCTIPKQDSSLSGADFAQLTCCRTGIPNPVILLIAFTHASASPTCAL